MIQKLKSLIPELFLIGATFYYWSLTALVINWLALALLAILLVLVFSQNKILGIAIGVFIFVINTYLIFALLSEFYEFSEFNDKAKTLLLMGSLFIGLNLVFSIWLLIKYSQKSANTSNHVSNTNNA